MRYSWNVRLFQFVFIILTINFKLFNCQFNNQYQLSDSKDAKLADQVNQNNYNDLIENEKKSENGFDDQIGFSNREIIRDENQNKQNFEISSLTQKESNKNDQTLGSDSTFQELVTNSDDYLTLTEDITDENLMNSQYNKKPMNPNDLQKLANWISQMRTYLNSFPKLNKGNHFEAIKKYNLEREREDDENEADLSGLAEESGKSADENKVQEEGIINNEEPVINAAEAANEESETDKEVEEINTDTNQESESEVIKSEEEAMKPKKIAAKFKQKNLWKKSYMKKDKTINNYTNKLSNLILAIGGLLIIVLIMIASVYSFVIKPSKKKVKHYEPIGTQFTL